MCKKDKWMKRIAALCGIFLVGILLLSTAFIAEEIGQHDCAGEECPICETIEECINNMYVCGLGVVLLTLFVVFTGVFKMITERLQIYRIIKTPVTYKVRLDN